MFSLAPQYYSPIYYGVVTILSLLVFSQYENIPEDRLDEAPRHNSLGIVLFTLLFAVFIGLRPVSAEFFVDMATYDAYYDYVEAKDFVFLSGTGNNILFDNLLSFMATNEVSSRYFFLVIAVIYFVGISGACSLFFPKDKMAAILVYFSAFSTFAYATNGIKAGAAAALFLVALALYERRQWIGVILLMLASLGIHHAMIVPVVAFVACQFVKNPKVYMAFWVICFVVSLFHITFFQEMFAGLVDEQGAGYLQGSGGHTRSDFFGGFRIDFVLYSLVPMVVGLIAIERKKIESARYIFLLNLYTLINAVWLLCMYSDFTNRIAYLSWMMYPIVLIYPFLNEDWEGPKYKIFQWVAYGHLAFNLFMVLIYW